MYVLYPLRTFIIHDVLITVQILYNTVSNTDIKKWTNYNQPMSKAGIIPVYLEPI